jgi:hypothetical protein
MDSNGFGPRQLFAVNSSLGVPCFINEKLEQRNLKYSFRLIF